MKDNEIEMRQAVSEDAALSLRVNSGPALSPWDGSAVRGRADEIHRKLTFGL
jgi:hypothetical protein